MHRDWPNYELSGLVHLSPDAPVDYGTAFHRHRATRSHRHPAAPAAFLGPGDGGDGGAEAAAADARLEDDANDERAWEARAGDRARVSRTRARHARDLRK